VSTLTIILIVVAVLAIAFGLIIYVQRERTRRLRVRFGPEYDRLARDRGSRRAEQELLGRQKRIEKFHIRELNPVEIDRFSVSWQSLQNQFVDTPGEAVLDADRLIRDILETRGYPMTDFEQRAADLSADHPRVIENYRAAHEIAVRHTAGNATTEELRQALVHYRALFQNLLSNKLEHPIPEVTR
jgi:hypothetical protein